MFTKHSSGLVINNDDSHYKAILAKREQKREYEKLRSDMNSMREELECIKSILKQILDGKKYG